MPQVAFCALLTLMQATMSVPSPDPSGWSPRANAPWTREEADLLRALQDHGVNIEDIAVVLGRSERALEFELNKKRLPDTLPNYPIANVPLCQEDLRLLNEVSEGPARLTWDFGQKLPREWSALANTPTLRVIEVEPEPLTRSWWPDTRDEGYWAAYRMDADSAVQVVWADLAARLVTARQRVLIWGDDALRQRRTAIRAMLQRMLGEAAPRNTVMTLSDMKRSGVTVLLDDPLRWRPEIVASLATPNVIVVLPYLRKDKGGGDPTFDVHPLPHLVRYRDAENAPKYIWERIESEFHRRQQWLAAAKGGRQLEVHAFRGTPNTERQFIRLEWHQLRTMPPLGRVIVPDTLTLVQAAVWFMLTREEQPELEPEQAALLSAGACLSPPLSAARWHADVAPSLPDLQSRLTQRCLLDVAHWPTRKSHLSMVVMTHDDTNVIPPESEITESHLDDLEFQHE